MNIDAALRGAQKTWDDQIVPTLKEYIRIPNKSPAFDPNWKQNGHMDRAVEMFLDWANAQPIPGLTVKLLEATGRTPLIFMEIPATGGCSGTVLLYGHLDKQPEMTGWREGLSPWEPVLEGDKLYGRGGADDGYAMFASLTAVMLVEKQNLPHARIVIIIEASEESGSPDLPAYIDALKDEIRTPDLVVCLDSGCGNYDQLWMTTSLRGVINGDLTVKILTEGVHSGSASGVVPDSFDIAVQVMESVYVDELFVLPPADRVEQASHAAQVLGDRVHSELPWVSGAHPETDNNTELLLAKTWLSTITVIGVDGFPPSLEAAGNVLRPYTTLRLSIRTPPTADATIAAEAMKQAYEEAPPNGAHVSFTVIQAMSGWNAPSLAPWLEQSVNDASMAFFGKPSVAIGEGGTIPFMGMLGAKFPEAQFLITGVLGPHSNAHGPNEFLHIPTGVRVTASVAKVIADHANR